jgi:methanethiol S-methyltransferase
MEYLSVASLWIGYCVIHSYLISIRFTNLMTRLLKDYYAFYRLFYILFSLALLIPLINFTTQSDTKIIITYSYTLSILRYALMYSALLMFFVAFFFNYDSLSFFGIRQMLDFGKTKKTNPSEALKRNGLLGMMRHPMYLALIVYLWCQTFRTMDIVINIVLTIYVIIGTILEEKKLVLEFGDTYIKYQQEVPMLIPFTKAKVR